MANINDAYGIIEQVNTAGNKYNIASTSCAFCETPAGTADKVAALAGFKYIPGVTVHVYFKYANTASNPTLNVNNEQAYPIMLYGTTNAGADDETNGWQAGSVVSFTYVEVDSTHKYWYRDQGYNTKNAGTVTSVRVQASSPLQSSTNTQQNTSLNTTISFLAQSHNTILAGPSSTSAADSAPSFRSLVAADIPNLNASKITNGILGVARGGTGASTFAEGEVLIGNGTSAVSTLAIDSSVTANSSNLITSGAVASAISGLTGAMHFIGVSSTAITNGGTQNPTIGGNTITTKTAGDVVIYGNQEFVWSTTNKWELLGDEGSYALDTAVIHKSEFTAKGQLIKGTGNGTYDFLAPNTATTGTVLYMASSTAAWKILGIKTEGHTAKAVTAVAYTANTGGWSTLNKGSGVSISGVDVAGTPTEATVTNAVLTITKGTATTKATAQTVPKLSDLSLSDGTWPTLNVTKTTDFLTGAEVSYS